MKYKCWDCGRVWDESELVTEREEIGEAWGSPAYQEWDYCPYCHSTELWEYHEEEEEDEEM